MRRDICQFYPRRVEDVFNAFITAIRSTLEKEPDIEPFHTLTFGLNFSWKFNMNGGSCTLRFMPYNNGTAVNIRYSIAQLNGARYEKHCKVYTQAVEGMLNVYSQEIKIDAEIFTDYCEKAAAVQQPPFYSQQPPTPQQLHCGQTPDQSIPQTQFAETQPQPTVTQSAHKFCANCGTKLGIDHKFCGVCGTKQP